MARMVADPTVILAELTEGIDVGAAAPRERTP